MDLVDLQRKITSNTKAVVAMDYAGLPSDIKEIKKKVEVMVNRRGRPIIHWNRYRYDESLGKWMRKKRYKHPVITVVKLDPEQALLVACKVDGAYWRGGTCVYGTRHTHYACETRGRRERTASLASRTHLSDLPS